MNHDDKILVRVRKLLSLSKSSTDAEAALAAARAAELMAEHQLSEAEVRLVDGGKAEPIVEGETIKAKKRIAWQWTLAFAAAKQFGCRGWTSTDYDRGRTSTIVILGRESQVQAATYTAQYLIREVDRLCEEAWEREGEQALKVGQSARTWKGSFRLGAAGAISRRIHHGLVAKVAERATARADAKERAEADPAAAPKIDALALVEREQSEVEEAYAKRTAGWGNSSSIGRIRSRTGYSAGREAGGGVSLGGSRAALGQGQGRLRGGK